MEEEDTYYIPVRRPSVAKALAEAHASAKEDQLINFTTIRGFVLYNDPYTETSFRAAAEESEAGLKRWHRTGKEDGSWQLAVKSEAFPQSQLLILNSSSMTMYFLAFVLPPALNEKVLRYKELMLEKFNCRVGLKSPAHVTIVPPFWMDEAIEREMIGNADRLCSGIPSFMMATEDFSAFKPRTIFIALKPNEDLARMKKASDAFFMEQNQYGMKMESRPFHPHITIATRDLFKRSFSEAWGYFEKEEFREEWLMEGLSILRHNNKNWDVVHTSQFKNL